MTSATKTRWIALLELRSLNDTNGAFCTAIAWVNDLKGFEELARKELAELGYELINLEEADRYSERTQAFEVSEECRQLSEVVSPEYPIQFCRFHRFGVDDE